MDTTTAIFPADYATLPTLTRFSVVDVANNGGGSAWRYVAFGVFFAAGLGIAYLQFVISDSGIMPEPVAWALSGALFVLMLAMMATVSKIDSGSIVFWKKENIRRGFDVIFKRKSR